VRSRESEKLAAGEEGFGWGLTKMAVIGLWNVWTLEEKVKTLGNGQAFRIGTT
jgi:hypothetical protein